MCGIAGILFPVGAGDAARARARRMQAVLRHRGPDEQGEWLEEDCALAHTRLSIIDLEHGQQPMVDPSGRYVVVFNGEIYNHRELRSELERSYAFSTTSDTETLLASYAVWGPGCVDELNGMFAFLVWDRQERRGFAARDALGVKPFVYRFADGELAFASEAKAVLAALESHPGLDLEALVEGFVVPGFSGVRTAMFRGIEHLPAGHGMSISRDGIEISRWYHHRLAWPGDADLIAGQLGGRLRRAFEASVVRTLLADVPIGVFLSGGLDSTAITTVASRSHDERLAAFTIRFEDHADIDFGRSPIVVADDAPFVEEVASSVPLDLHRVTVRRHEVVPRLDELVRADDRLLVWEQQYVQHALAAAAARHRKVVLVGDAADESHFGYFWFLDEHVTRSPRGLMELFGAERRAGCLAPALREELRPLERFAGLYEEHAATSGYHFDTPAARTRAATYLVLELWLGRLLHNGDIHTMAHGLEARVPFSDRELLAHAERVPPSVGFAGGVEKSLLREALRPFVPPSVFERRKSALPRDPRLAPLYQEALLAALEEEREFAQGFFDVARLRELCALPTPSDIERTVLFGALALLRWHRAYGP